MTTFPEVREALADDLHTSLPWIGAGPSYGAPLPMELTSVVTDTEPDSECDITICRDAVTPDVLLICAAVNAAPAMLAHIDAQAAEIERLHVGIADSHKGIAARDAALTKHEADDVRYLRNMAEKDAEIERLSLCVAMWQALYRRAINEANGLTNYVEERPELRRTGANRAG